MTTPLTHNTDVYDPSELTLTTSKKKDAPWAQPIFVLQRRGGIRRREINVVLAKRGSMLSQPIGGTYSVWIPAFARMTV